MLNKFFYSNGGFRQKQQWHAPKTADMQVPHNIALAIQARNSTSCSQYTLEPHLQSFSEGCKYTKWKPSINGRYLNIVQEINSGSPPSTIKH